MSYKSDIEIAQECTKKKITEIAVVAGVWKDTIGIVQKLDYGKQTATINVELFGRETPVEISFAEVRKL